jgi:hypothetical protein
MCLRASTDGTLSTYNCDVRNEMVYANVPSTGVGAATYVYDDSGGRVSESFGGATRTPSPRRLLAGHSSPRNMLDVPETSFPPNPSSCHNSDRIVVASKFRIRERQFTAIVPFPIAITHPLNRRGEGQC